MSNIGYLTAASGVIGFRDAMDITANNLANVNTNGFKASRPSFGDLIYTNRNTTNQQVQTGHGQRIDKTDLMFEQSQLRSTDRALDYALTAEGLFAVRSDDGNTYYTKDGAFFLTADGETADGKPNYKLCDSKGGYVLDANGADITVPFEENGTDIDYSALKQMIGKFKFQNPYGLDQVGDNYLQANASSGGAIRDDDIPIKDGYLEASGTSVANEMSKVIEYQRAFQLNINMVKTHNELENIVNNLRN